MQNKNNFLLILLIAAASVTACKTTNVPKTETLSKEVLMDKIKGGWAGQVIGCTYGGPTEFKFCGEMIPDDHEIAWVDGLVKHNFLTNVGLYDDIYMDLTFVETFDRLGLDAPVDSFALAFANADYMLWHANQAARYNILNGIMPPESGYWKNNPHANDIDYQIEADFAGLMCPGMPNSASEISDKIGHIMNYGDGWYGGVYVGAMYTLAFIYDDIKVVVKEALKTIPKESLYYKAMNDVIKWYEQNPTNWKATWQNCQDKYSEDITCPHGTFEDLNIDALINSAYVVIGLLYGNGDFAKTIDISTRCGQDSDCNPATAAGILGTMIGYDSIPPIWLNNVIDTEDLVMEFTRSSMNDTYRMSFEQALGMIERGGGSVTDSTVTILCQSPVPVKLEVGFENVYPYDRPLIDKSISEFTEFEFEGTGFALRGNVTASHRDYVAIVEVYIDGELYETANLPKDFSTRRLEHSWVYDLPYGKHKVEFKWLNPEPDANIECWELTLYSDKPAAKQ